MAWSFNFALKIEQHGANPIQNIEKAGVRLRNVYKAPSPQGNCFDVWVFRPKCNCPTSGHAWAQYPAWVMTAVAGLVFVSENAWLVALALVAVGVYLLNKKTSANGIEVHIPAPIPQPNKLERLQIWHSEAAKKAGVSKPEILRAEQLEHLAKLSPENVDAMFGVLDTFQIERYGKQLLQVL
ncbi:MAG: HRDC domain-containing protein [Deinococcales bacterium]